MTRIYRWPEERWIRATHKPTGKRGWIQRLGAAKWTFFDGLIWERELTDAQAAEQLVTERGADGKPVVEGRERAQELTALYAYAHRD